MHDDLGKWLLTGSVITLDILIVVVAASEVIHMPSVRNIIVLGIVLVMVGYSMAVWVEDYDDSSDALGLHVIMFAWLGAFSIIESIIRVAST